MARAPLCIRLMPPLKRVYSRPDERTGRAMRVEQDASGGSPWDFGRGLAGYAWRATVPRARLLLAHGFAEYAERYSHSYNGLVARLNAMGVDVFAFDMRGHGRSPGARGVVNLRTAIEDHHAARDALAAPGKPFFLFGHSLGGLVTAASVAQDQDRVAGVILSAPALHIRAPFHLRAIAGVVGALAPGARVAPPLDAAGLSRIAEEVEAYRNDPMVSDPRVPARTGATAISISKSLWTLYPRWHAPVLVLHGEQDTATDPEGSKRFINSVGAADRHLELYPEGQHELLNDLDRDAALGVILAWLEARLGQG